MNPLLELPIALRRVQHLIDTSKIDKKNLTKALRTIDRSVNEHTELFETNDIGEGIDQLTEEYNNLLDSIE